MFKAVGPLWAQATAGDNAFAKLVNTGRKVLRKVFKKDVGSIKGTELPKPTWSLSAKPIQLTDTTSWKLIGGLFPKQAWNTQAAEFRRRAALRLIGNTRKVPVFAFVGFSLGASLERKGDNKDDVLCSGIRGLFQQYEAKTSHFTFEDQQFSLASLELGKLIGKGCNAAVYEARPAMANDAPQTEPELESAASSVSIREDSDDTEVIPDSEGTVVPGDTTPADAPVDVSFGSSPSATSENGSPVSNAPAYGLADDDDFSIIDEDEQDSQSSDGDLNGWVFYRVSSPRSSSPDPDGFSDTDSDIYILAADDEALEPIPETLDNDSDVGWNINRSPAGSESADYMAGSAYMSGSSERMSDTTSSYLSSETSHDQDILSTTSDTTEVLEPVPNISVMSEEDYPLAVKMMYNYSIESRADCIMSAMAREMVPAQSHLDEPTVGIESAYAQKTHLPSHPNIVTMHGMFVDKTPKMPGDSDEYPSALPPRLHADGLGRNSTLFLVMKKYSMTLREFLAINDVSMETRCRLLAQLLEGITHLGQHGIAHRDLKSDNILIDLTNGKEQPLLAISDFGCCLADTVHGLKIPYSTGEVDKGGNCALMAPEIKCTKPGVDVVLDYTFADLWAVGALAYEIFGLENPFYSHLDARYYVEKELPALPAGVPETVRRLVCLMLQRDPQQRPSCSAAASVMQIFFWAPANLQPFQPASPSGHDKSQLLWQYRELCDWLEQLAVEAVCQRIFRSDMSKVDTLLKQLFLSRVTREDILTVLSFA